MKLEIGKRYVTRNGTITGPMEEGSPDATFGQFRADFGNGRASWRGDGRFSWAANDAMDLVREADVDPDIQSLIDNAPESPKVAQGAAKTPLALIPPVAADAIAKVHQHGADRYGPWNWRGSKVPLMTYLHAMRRHIDAVIDGQDLDPDSGLPHVAHVAASCNIILDAHAFGTLVDDRSPKRL